MRAGRAYIAAMSQTLTLQLPDDLARQARSLAAAANRPLEEAAVEWIARAVTEPLLDPAVFPDDVLRFAAERGVPRYLVPL